MKYHYLSNDDSTYSVRLKLATCQRVLELRLSATAPVDLCGKHSQVGSLAGAAYLLNNNAGVLR